jgi:hypothetical protein
VAYKIDPEMLLIRENTETPDAVRLETESFAPGWRLLLNLNRKGLDRVIRGAGWTFFCLAGEIEVTVFGRNRENGASTAVKRILSKLKLADFNCLEITEIISKRFLGLPCTVVRARSRHIQESVFLLGAKKVRRWTQAVVAA